ncbi:MAG: hypothetical protein WD114_00405 [Phycisphaerales bacterium]
MDAKPSSTPIPETQRWVAHLRALSAPVVADVPFDGDERQRQSYIAEFTDEYGNRRGSDRPFLANLLGVELETPAIEMGLDERLWWLLQSGRIDAGRVEGLIAPRGPLAIGSESLAIEYRTMVELGALHALWLIARRADSASLRNRCLDAAGWHTRELQPDNAIHRPWGVQVFIALAQSETDDEIRHLAHLHAQTLVHNSCVHFGRPDLLSALILMDASEQLDQATRSP